MKMEMSHEKRREAVPMQSNVVGPDPISAACGDNGLPSTAPAASNQSIVALHFLTSLLSSNSCSALQNEYCMYHNAEYEHSLTLIQIRSTWYTSLPHTTLTRP